MITSLYTARGPVEIVPRPPLLSIATGCHVTRSVSEGGTTEEEGPCKIWGISRSWISPRESVLCNSVVSQI